MNGLAIAGLPASADGDQVALTRQWASILRTELDWILLELISRGRPTWDRSRSAAWQSSSARGQLPGRALGPGFVHLDNITVNDKV